jgi:hypothetical protein
MNEITIDTLVRAARLAGFDWTEQDLQPVRPGIELALTALARLERLPLAGVEPTTMYRVL